MRTVPGEGSDWKADAGLVAHVLEERKPRIVHSFTQHASTTEAQRWMKWNVHVKGEFRGTVDERNELLAHCAAMCLLEHNDPATLTVSLKG